MAVNPGQAKVQEEVDAPALHGASSPAAFQEENCPVAREVRGRAPEMGSCQRPRVPRDQQPWESTRMDSIRRLYGLYDLRLTAEAKAQERDKRLRGGFFVGGRTEPIPPMPSRPPPKAVAVPRVTEVVAGALSAGSYDLSSSVGARALSAGAP